MRSHHSSAAPWASDFHTPVLADEIVTLMSARRTILDGTLGGGGHSLALLEHGAMVTALDRDPQAVAAARERLRAYEQAGRFRVLVGNFAEIDFIDELASVRFDGILLDLGVSSHQIDDPERGFSFREGAPLDMRMGEDAPMTAADYLNRASEHDLAFVFRHYADERRALRLAREIVRRRRTRRLATSDDLVGAIRATLGPRSGPAEFARLFQAVRIEVNGELVGLERALPLLRDRLTAGGILVVISYHSGEDRIVKQAMREWSADCVCPSGQPVCTCRGRPLGTTLTRRATVPRDDEMAKNPRARSARLRAWQSAA